MSKKTEKETAPEKEGAVLTTPADAEVIIEDVMKDAQEAKNVSQGVFKANGGTYAFVDETPEKLSLDEGVFTQEEILLNKELMLSLISNNCIFIKKI